MIRRVATQSLFKSGSQLQRSLVCVSQMGIFQTQAKRTDPNKIKPYQRLFFSTPITQVDVRLGIAMRELRPKVIYIMANRCCADPKLIHNSTETIVEGLYSIRKGHTYERLIGSLCQNITKVISQEIDLQCTGILKPGTTKKLLSIFLEADCVSGQKFNLINCFYLLHLLKESLRFKKQFTDSYKVISERLRGLQRTFQRLRKSPNQNSEQIQKVEQEVNDEKKSLLDLKRKKMFLKQDEFLAAVSYILEKGYYNGELIKIVEQHVLSPNSLFPNQQQIERQQDTLYYQTLSSENYNREQEIACQMFSCLQYRLRILNQIKRIKLETGVTLYTEKATSTSSKNTPQNQPKQSTQSDTEEDPVRGVVFNHEEDSTSKKATQTLLVEEQIISKRDYLKLVQMYLDFIGSRDSFLWLTMGETKSEFHSHLITEFFSFLQAKAQSQKLELTLATVKETYMRAFYQIFDFESNGHMFSNSTQIEEIFETVLKMFDYGDRRSVWGLLKKYELLVEISDYRISQNRSVFAVCNKYGYKSNILASKFKKRFLKKLNARQYDVNPFKEGYALRQMEECKRLSIFLQLLDLNANQHSSLRTGQHEVSELYSENVSEETQRKVVEIESLMGQNVISQAVEKYMDSFKRLCGFLYYDQQNSSMVGSSLRMKLQIRDMTSEYQKKFVDAHHNVGDVVSSSRELIERMERSLSLAYRKQVNLKKAWDNGLIEGPEDEPIFVKETGGLSFLEQVCALLELLEANISLKEARGTNTLDEAFTVFRSLFEKEVFSRLIFANMSYPGLLRLLAVVVERFKNPDKSNSLLEALERSAGVGLEKPLHELRLKFSKNMHLMGEDQSCMPRFQPLLGHAEANPLYQPNPKVFKRSPYEPLARNIQGNLRSDVIPEAVRQNSRYEEIFRSTLASLKTAANRESLRSMKFQINYFEYPYVADLAINKNKDLFIFLVREDSVMNQNGPDNCLRRYFLQSEGYFSRKSRNVFIVRNEEDIHRHFNYLFA